MSPPSSLSGRLQARPQASGLKGRVRPPGDKSISHRALLLNGLGVTTQGDRIGYYKAEEA